MSKKIQNETRTMGKAVSCEWIDVNKLQSFSSYQRAINQNHVIKILANFDERKVNPICVSYRNGKYYVVDGQHTLTALKARGVEKVLCHIRHGLTEQEESEWFVELEYGYGKQKKATMLNAKLLSGKYENIEAINEIVKIVGYELDLPTSKGSGRPIIRATKALENLYNEFGEDTFAKALKLHSEIWAGDKKSIQENFLKGFLKFYDTYSEELDLNRMDYVFGKNGKETSAITKEANALKEYKSVSIRYAITIAKSYNYGIRKSPKLKVSKLED